MAAFAGMTGRVTVIAFASMLAYSIDAAASGHGPVFGAATPTLGRGAWSVDQAWTMRFGADAAREHMLKTMVTFGITEVLQVSGSIPELMSDNTLAPSRMMSAMSNDREFEGLLGYRFQRKPIGIGGRRESTLYVGGTAPMEKSRGASLVVGAATGYAGRAHYVWVGGNIQHYFERRSLQLGQSRTVTAVYGYRPPPLRVEAGRPDLRFFVEAVVEDRAPVDAEGVRVRPGPRTLFVGPTSLLVYKAVALSGGIQWAAYQRLGAGPKESARVAVNFSYFWFR